jgi:hypothetical protein
MNEEKQRRGKFTLSGEMMRTSDFEILKYLMAQVVVFHTEARFDRDEITYYAYHPSFEISPEWQVAPLYEAIVDVQGDGEVEVTWRKVE